MASLLGGAATVGAELLLDVVGGFIACGGCLEVPTANLLSWLEATDVATVLVGAAGLLLGAIPEGVMFVVPWLAADGTAACVVLLPPLLLPPCWIWAAACMRFWASRSRATRAAFKMACRGNPVAMAASIKSGATDPSGDRIADQIALAKACFASCDKTTFGLEAAAAIDDDEEDAGAGCVTLGG